MHETVYNLFVYTTLDLITEVGLVSHDISGSDEEKINFLQARVDHDLQNATKFELPDSFQIRINGEIRQGIDYASYRDLCNQGYQLSIFQRTGIPCDALVVITPVRNGAIYVEGIQNITAPTSPEPSSVYIEKQKEWYLDYIDNEGFHFDKLINDDFIQAVKILYNARHNVSSMKLLMIALDTMAYLEYGDSTRNFQTWLDTYTDIDKLNITSDELKEFRNSLLHMTNLDSRKVQLKKVKRLMFYDAPAHIKYVQETDEGKYFKFKDLIDCIAQGISKWARTYNIEKEKFETFLNRYDRIISDKRMTYSNAEITDHHF
ncbi:MAG: hypothetical protein J7502_06635 [Flavisolibacter sp.]|nr:hypothetical protein [Flavisolibacter sp.]